MRSFHLAGLAVIAVLAAAPVSAGEFLLAIDDVPLAKGLAELPDPLVFESDQGRVVKTVAAGKTSKASIQFFYMQALPQLGWTRFYPEWESFAFQRENERLSIEVKEDPTGGGAKVTFELVVKLASVNLPG